MLDYNILEGDSTIFQWRSQNISGKNPQSIEGMSFWLGSIGPTDVLLHSVCRKRQDFEINAVKFGHSQAISGLDKNASHSWIFPAKQSISSLSVSEWVTRVGRPAAAA